MDQQSFETSFEHMLVTVNSNLSVAQRRKLEQSQRARPGETWWKVMQQMESISFDNVEVLVRLLKKEDDGLADYVEKYAVETRKKVMKKYLREAQHVPEERDSMCAGMGAFMLNVDD